MPALDTSPAVHEATVCDRREPVAGVVVLGCRAPELARGVQPGQFVMVVSPGGERVAVALGVYEAEGERISLMLVAVGPRTRELALLRRGDSIVMLGPLGSGFAVNALGPDVALVAGGVGIASLLLAARTLFATGAQVTLYYGARTREALVDVDLFRELGCTVACATDDGSFGRHGFVTELLAPNVGAHSAIAACGPSAMLRTVGRMATAAGVRAQLSLEETFACGVGACWGCVVPLDRASLQAPRFPPVTGAETRDYVHARICKEGPVFWAHELRW